MPIKAKNKVNESVASAQGNQNHERKEEEELRAKSGNNFLWVCHEWHLSHYTPVDPLLITQTWNRAALNLNKNEGI